MSNSRCLSIYALAAGVSGPFDIQITVGGQAIITIETCQLIKHC